MTDNAEEKQIANINNCIDLHREFPSVFFSELVTSCSAAVFKLRFIISIDRLTFSFYVFETKIIFQLRACRGVK